MYEINRTVKGLFGKIQEFKYKFLTAEKANLFFNIVLLKSCDYILESISYRKVILTMFDDNGNIIRKEEL